MSNKIIHAQRNFSGGQIDETSRHLDTDTVLKTGGRQMSNFRHTQAGHITQRPGRVAVSVAAGAREEYVRMAASYEYLIAFTAGWVTITDLSGSVIFTAGGYPWQNKDLPNIVWCQADFALVVCYPGMQPQLLTWDRIAHTWSVTAFAFIVQSGVTKEPFYRFSVPGATMTYSGVSGSITLTCSVAYFQGYMIGARLSILGCQVIITAILGPTTATAAVINRLPDCIGVPVNSNAAFSPGQVVETSVTGLKFEVGSVGTVGSANWVYGCLMGRLTFDPTTFTNDPIEGYSGTACGAGDLVKEGQENRCHGQNISCKFIIEFHGQIRLIAYCFLQEMEIFA